MTGRRWPRRARRLALLLATTAAAAAGAGEANVAAAFRGTEHANAFRRLDVSNADAIDACPVDWESYFSDDALSLVCPCLAVQATDMTGAGPDTSYQRTKIVEACPTTTARSIKTTLGPTTTTLVPTTETSTTTLTTTTLYCESCSGITAPPPPTTKTTSTTTTTRTSRTSSTSTDTTSATTTLTGPTQTSTSTVGTTMTSSSTKSTTTTTSRTSTTTLTSTTVTSTTVSTTVLQPCSICPLYHFVCPEGCTNCVSPGRCRTVYQTQQDMFNSRCDLRKALSPPDNCVDFASVELSCPDGNGFSGRPVLLDNGAYPKIQCRVCGIDPLPTDGDGRRGFWGGTVAWGPNQFLRNISETQVSAYKVYIVDSMYQKLGAAVATIEPKGWATLRLTCCDTQFYQAPLVVELPQNATYFMVVPVTRGGLELNVGPVSARIVDLGVRVSLAGAVRHHGGALLGLQAWLAALLLQWVVARSTAS